jgi:hypothetical protein
MTAMTTLRERMKKPITKAALYTAIVGMGGAIGLVHGPLLFMVLILVGWGLVSIAIILAMQWRTRCPVCNTMLGANGRAVIKDHPTIDSCQHCGVNFDQSMP